jgi:hypothetical protein
MGEITGLPVIELDKIFWQPDLIATPPEQWAQIQQKLAAQERWIWRRLGLQDAVEVRLRAADGCLPDFGAALCPAGWLPLNVRADSGNGSLPIAGNLVRAFCVLSQGMLERRNCVDCATLRNSNASSRRLQMQWAFPLERAGETSSHPVTFL